MPGAGSTSAARDRPRLLPYASPQCPSDPDQINTALAGIVVSVSVTTLVKAIRSIFGTKALPTTSKPNPRVRKACERLTEAGELICEERGHTCYTIEPALALTHQANLDRARALGLPRKLEDRYDRLLGQAPR